jgi:hypothetical protein
MLSPRFLSENLITTDLAMTIRSLFLLPTLLAAGFLASPVSAQQSGLTAETWTGLTPGKSILILRKEGISTRAPNTTQTVTEARITGLPANSGTRLRGTITPMVDDTYTFWVNGTDNVALWLSEDGTRFIKSLIANHLGSTTTTEWSKHRDQKSIPIALTAGTTYHIEAHVMSSVANGHLAIAWQGRKGNWALAANGATATQSTTQWNLGAGNAIDGNTSGVWNQGTMTTNVQNSWLKVDFAATRPLNQIVLFNNSNDQLRLSNFRLSALDGSGTVLAQQDFFTTSGNVGNSFTWDMPSVVQAKSIKIQLLGNNRAGNGHLALAEIQACHVTPPPTNWALASNGSTATQSTTSSSYLASLAIDGNTNGDLNAGSVTLTQDQANSWLKVDLGQDRPVNRVVLHNRNTLQTRLSNFRVSLLDATDNVLATRDYFPSTGNAGPILYWNLSNPVQARAIRVELLGQNLDGNGYLSLAEVQAFEINPLLESRDFQVIPASYLGAVMPDPDDQNDNNLSDIWEQQTGLSGSSLPGSLLEFGDPENDAIFNFQEQWLNANPLVKEAVADGLTRSIWTGINGPTITDMLAAKSFYGYPNSVSHVPGVNETINYTLFGSRYRGAIVAPVTGAYRFWICGSAGVELWFSDGSVQPPGASQPLTNRFGKQRIGTSGYVTPVRDFDYSPSQRSGWINLIQGQKYYIEVLHSQQNGTDHVSLAWQVPGQLREIIPASAFQSDIPEDDDADNDNLPDSWEASVTLSTTDNGFINSKEGEFGDFDNDRLTNLFEYQRGTNPKSNDSDGDGVSDFDEIKHYGSDPLVSNNLAPVAITMPQLNQYSAATVGWTANSNGTLSAWERRGEITYTFTVTDPGVHEVVVAAGAIAPVLWYTRSLNLVLSLDDDTPFATGTITSKDGNAGTLRAVTPWLSVGTHTLTILHDNFLAELRLRLDSVSISRLGGTDLDEDGIPDWIKGNEAAANALTRVPTQCRTSPVSIEGVTRQYSSTALTALMPGATAASSIPVSESVNNSFFADVPLSPDGAVTLNASFLGGVITESHSITWIPTNLLAAFANNTLHIRKGDSLRATAHAPDAAPAGTFTLQGSTGCPPTPTSPTPSSSPVALTFNTVGTHTLTATWHPDSGPAQTASVSIVVHSADFGPAHLVLAGTPRTWSLPTLDATTIVEADDRLVFSETTTIPQSGPRTFKVGNDQAANRHVIARLPDGIDGSPSAILARGTVHGFDIAQVDETRDALTVHRYDDGIWLMHSTVVAINLPEGVIIRLTAKNQGTLFSNGLTFIDLRAADFDANGIAHVYYEWTGTGDPKLCHTASILTGP